MERRGSSCLKSVISGHRSQQPAIEKLLKIAGKPWVPRARKSRGRHFRRLPTAPASRILSRGTPPRDSKVRKDIFRRLLTRYVVNTLTTHENQEVQAPTTPKTEKRNKDDKIVEQRIWEFVSVGGFTRTLLVRRLLQRCPELFELAKRRVFSNNPENSPDAP